MQSKTLRIDILCTLFLFIFSSHLDSLSLPPPWILSITPLSSFVCTRVGVCVMIFQ